MENVSIASFYRFCVVATIITMRLLILEILCGDESLISIFDFLSKAIVPVYYSVYLPLLLSKKILSCSLCFIKFLILCTLRSIILSLRFFFYLAVLYLLSVFLTSNMSCIVSDDFNDFRSFIIFSNNPVAIVDVHVNVNVVNYLNSKNYDHDFQSKRECNSKNVKPEILFPVFSLLFYYIFFKHNCELRIKIFEFVLLILVLNIRK